MVDINLLKDTKDEDPNRRKKTPVRPQFDLSAPGRERLDDREGKPPSKFSVWVKGLFGAKPVKRDVTFTPERAPRPRPMRGEKVIPPEVVSGPTDIFAEVDKHRTTPPPPKVPAPEMRTVNGKKPVTPATVKSTPLPGSFLVNLLPEDLSVSPVEVRQRLVNLGFIALFAVVGVVGIYFLLVFYQTNFLSKTANVQEDITAVQADIQKLRPTQLQALEFVQRVELLKSTLDRHIYWTNFFDKLDKYTIQNVAISSVFKASLGTGFTLDGTALTIDDVAHQLAVLQQAAPDFVTDAKLELLARAQAFALNGANEGAEGYSFSISVKLVDGLFIKTDQPAASADTTGTTAP